MKNDLIAQILSNLYLRAVLASLTEFIKIDHDARDLIEKSNFSLSMAVFNGPSIVLNIHDGKIIVCPPGFRPISIKLLFLTHHHLNQFFSGNKWLSPIPLKGFFQINSLRKFMQLSERLNTILLDITFTHPMYTQLIFYILGQGLLILAQFDPMTQIILKDLPVGLAEFSIDHEGIQPFWFDNSKNGYDGGQGKAPRLPDVSIRFTDLHVANEAFTDRLDTLAAIGTGRIKIEGLIPLADGLSLVMEKLNLYLQQ